MSKMSIFDEEIAGYDHRFVRQNPKILFDMFGTENLEPFWIADMSFKVPEPVTLEFQRLVDRGIYAYELASPEVFDAITRWNKKRHNLALNPKNFCQVTGVLTGLAISVRELTAPGEGVLIQTPVYHQFARLIKTAGRKIVRNPLKIVDGNYEMDFEDLEEKLSTEDVKIILLCNPHNPVGRVWKKTELERLVQIADHHGIKIVSDEIHSDIIYTGYRFQSIAEISNKHLSVLGSPAKTFGMQSISEGYLYLQDGDLRKSIKDTLDSMYLNHGSAFSTFGTIAAFQSGDAWLDSLLNYLEQTIHWMQDYIESEMPRVKMFPVEGTYQVWLDFRETKLSADDLYATVANKANLALTPGSWFDRDSALYMRMNIASPLSTIKSALERLNSALR